MHIYYLIYIYMYVYIYYIYMHIISRKVSMYYSISFKEVSQSNLATRNWKDYISLDRTRDFSISSILTYVNI